MGYEGIGATTDGSNVAGYVMGSGNAGVLLCIVKSLSAGANADNDITMPYAFRVLHAKVILTGAGVASSVMTVKNGTTAITNSMATSGSDKAVVEATTIDDASYSIASGGTLRLTSSGGVSQPAQLVLVFGVKA